jgi:hypothetical protein
MGVAMSGLPLFGERPRAPLRLTDRVKPEHELQREVSHALRIMLPREAFLTAIDHANKASGKFGARLQGRGAVSGLPDLWIIWRGRSYLIELKRKGGRVSDTQQLCHELLRRAEARIAVCHSLDEALDALRGWGIPLRGRIAA